MRVPLQESSAVFRVPAVFEGSRNSKLKGFVDATLDFHAIGPELLRNRGNRRSTGKSEKNTSSPGSVRE